MHGTLRGMAAQLRFYIGDALPGLDGRGARHGAHDGVLARGLARAWAGHDAAVFRRWQEPFCVHCPANAHACIRENLLMLEPIFHPPMTFISLEIRRKQEPANLLASAGGARRPEWMKYPHD